MEQKEDDQDHSEDDHDRLEQAADDVADHLSRALFS
jgi:hypothetical protein